MDKKFTKLKYKLFFNLTNRLQTKIGYHLLREIYLRKSCKEVGVKVLALGEVSGFHKNVTIKDYCGFNGLNILGSAEIVFGSYFHSGQNITIITDNYNSNF